MSVCRRGSVICLRHVVQDTTSVSLANPPPSDLSGSASICVAHMGGRGIQDDRFGLKIGQQAFSAAFPTNTRLFESAKSDAEIRTEIVVADSPRA